MHKGTHHNPKKSVARGLFVSEPEASPTNGPGSDASKPHDISGAAPDAAPASQDAGPASQDGVPAPPEAAVAAPPQVEPGRVGARPRKTRPHPYAEERSTPEEAALRPERVTAFWLGLATVLALAGLYLGSQFSPYWGGPRAAASWDAWTQVFLFSGLGLLGFGFVGKDWARRLVMGGWLLFGFYWSLVALDLLVATAQDYVNFGFALAGTYFFTYLAYHQWLNKIRHVENHTVRFLNISTFIAATSYFIIDKIQVVSLWLIRTVSDHTYWMLDLFGQAKQKGLAYVYDGHPSQLDAPTSFFYPQFYCESGRLYPYPWTGVDKVSEYCSAHGFYSPGYFLPPDGFLASLLHFQPDGDHRIIPVSIILACTALQSIMLFVGLFMGTQAPLSKRIKASLVVAVVVYVLNLLRNTGIIWFYGQGVMSFWVIHDLIGKGGSLLAMIAIAFVSFRFFPEFLKELVGVLDLPHRDGPMERMLRLGKRRPGQD